MSEKFSSAPGVPPIFRHANDATLEYPLHLWTYRLKFLQGELGGWTMEAQGLADTAW